MITQEEINIYRKVEQFFVKEDALVRAKDTGIELSDEEAEAVGNRWAYNGDYDCNLSYWDNIDNLITEVKGKE